MSDVGKRVYRAVLTARKNGERPASIAMHHATWLEIAESADLHRELTFDPAPKLLGLRVEIDNTRRPRTWRLR